MDDSEAPKTPEISKSLSRELEEVISKQNLLTSRTRRRVLMSLQEQTNTEEDAEMEKLRQKAIDEIINSEKSYLKQLEIVDEFFMKPLQENGHLDSQIYASIFGDLLGIRQVNKELLTAMEISTDKIGQVFLDLAPYLKFYSTYANDFKTATNLVEEQLNKNKPFRQFMERQESRPEVCKKLNALLITPVQRIPRYKLLLDDIIKNTPRYHPDKDNLMEARTQIDAIAWYINDQIEDFEKNRTMIDIQKSLVAGLPKIIKPDRKLIKQGSLMKMNKSGGHAQPRYVILFSDMLMYCKFKGTLNGSILDLPKTDALEVCCVLPLKHTSVEEVVGKGVFTIKCQAENLMLYSPKAEDSDWVDQIKKAIRVLKKNRTTLKRESSMFQPMRKPDLIKVRRESLGKIMLMRKTDEAKIEMLKKDSKTSLKSTLRLLSPMKRPAKDSPSGSPFKLKRLAEEERSPAPSAGDSPDLASPVFAKPFSPALRASPRLRARNDSSPGSPDLKQNRRRNTKTMTLERLVGGYRQTRAKKMGTVFRSPSIYEENNSRLFLKREPDTMSSYLSGKICPLTPSTKPCNVDHLVQSNSHPRQEENDKTDVPEAEADKEKEEEAEEKVVVEVKEDDVEKAEELEFKPAPIALHDGILNENSNVKETVSEEKEDDIQFKPAPIAPHDGILNKKSSCVIS